jgi:hypothetical protein
MSQNWTTNDFLTFINEREQIRLKRKQGLPPPWTDDPILQHTRFTNIDRIHDSGTQMILNHVQNLDIYSQIFYIVLYRSAYSSKSLLLWFGKDWHIDIKRVRDEQLPNLGRMAYQLYLQKSETIQKFLVNKAFPIVENIADRFKHHHSESLVTAATHIAADFHSVHSLHLIFLGTEIAKDLASLHPERIDPNSSCPMNTGARKALKRIYRSKSQIYKIAQLQALTGFSESKLEHALCEWNRYTTRFDHVNEGKPLLKQWLWKPSDNFQ